MSLHTDGRGNWLTGTELNQLQEENSRSSAAVIFAIAGAFVGPKVGAVLGLSGGKSMVLGFIAGALVGYAAGLAIIGLGVIGLLVWWFIKA